MKLKACLKSMRLRTLPLSEAGVALGMFIAFSKSSVNLLTAIFLIMTTALLQILSNISNELGDFLHGTDTVERQGIHYSIQDGEMTVPQMKKMISFIMVLCCLCGLAMIYTSFGTFFALEPALLILLGAAAIWAAMHYTLGDNPYGYNGYGDLFVFIFFGLVSVYGSYYVCTHDLGYLLVMLPAAAIGCFSIGVLNVNNIRDMKTDIENRVTIAIKLGDKRARIYQTILIIAGWALLITYTALTADNLKSWLYIITFPFFILHLKGVRKKEGKALDPMLPLLVISTFATSILMGIGIIV